MPVSANEGWKIVASASELPSMSMKHIEIEGREIALINFGGKYYAISDRCGHMNSPLSRGQLRNVGDKSIVVCPLHGSTFDISSGKNVSGPVKPPPSDLSCLAQAVRDQMTKAAELSAMIKVQNVESFEVVLDGNDIKLNLMSVKK
jgi:nitrite reductase/ring-hydroxylating ferredoxin subunit